jgi:hypothetical protein
MIGRIPIVLKIKMHINHARWLFRAAFHIAISFQTESQIDRTTINGMSHDSIE